MDISAGKGHTRVSKARHDVSSTLGHTTPGLTHVVSYLILPLTMEL